MQRSPTTVPTQYGAVDGVHDFTFEILQHSNAPYCIGTVVGDLCTYDFLGGPCVCDDSSVANLLKRSKSTEL